MSTAQLISEARARSGLTQAEFATRAGTSQPTLSAYERGHRAPTLAVLRRFVEASRGRLVLRYSPTADERPSPPADRGDELIRVLELAAHFPARHRPTLDLPRFGAP
jgi:transcriptional regulator with XRE-family HTH domain